MAKIKLGARPNNFKPFPVKFEMPDGTEGIINVTYRYRTKSEFGKLLDDLNASGKKAGAEVVGNQGGDATAEFSWEKFYEANNQACAESLVNSIAAWDLDEPIAKETFLQMGDEVPAAVVALMGSYASACRDGRLGN